MSSGNIAEANIAIATERFCDVPGILKNENMHDLKASSMLAMSLFYLGDFEESYNMYWTNKLGEHTLETFDPFGETVKMILEETGNNELINLFSYIIKNDYPQNKEDSNERYPEFYQYNFFLQQCIDEANSIGVSSNVYFNQKLQRLFDSGDSVKIAQAHYIKAELALVDNNFNEAIGFYLQASITEKHRAIYYGYCGNILYKTVLQNPDDSITELISASILTWRAIKLDENNARWHYYEGMILLMLGMWFNKVKQPYKGFMYSSEMELKKALSLLRNDQLGLKKAIEDILRVVEKNITSFEGLSAF